ncbi:hypothetical protein [Nostoc sp.]|uniref:hypothetical protein n=1 Tax=Nostoc sp. TaxID=1180 RepID=UPI002FFCC9B7
MRSPVNQLNWVWKRAIANCMIELSSFRQCLRLATPTHLQYSALQLMRDAIARFLKAQRQQLRD